MPDLSARLTKDVRPLFDPSRETWCDALNSLGRAPFKAQGDGIMGLHRVLETRKSAVLVGECGVGKTLMASALSYVHLGDRYRVLVMCPGHLVEKWAREIIETVPDAWTKIVWRVSDLFDLDKGSKPRGREYFIIPRDRAKLGFRRKAACLLRRRPYRKPPRGESFDSARYVACPQCAAFAVNERTGRPITIAELDAKAHACKKCGSPLWEADHAGVRRYPPAEYIKRRLSGVFDLFVADEVHELKGADTAQGNTLGMLASAARKTLCLTGTLIGGYAEHLFYLLYRVQPQGMLAEGLQYKQVQEWISRYGALERITKRPLDGGGNGRSLVYSRGSTAREYVRHRPGVSPLAFARHLLQSTVFVELADVADELPAFSEDVEVVPMSEPLESAYKALEADFKRIMADRAKASRFLGLYLATLLSYPDRPFDNRPIPELARDPEELRKDATYPKEERLIEYVEEEISRRRRVWVFATFTNTRDVTARLQGLLRKRGVRATVLRQDTVEMAERESWITQQVRDGIEVVISNPELVKTGLDLLAFPSLAFYETGYNTFTLMQASRRSWRVGQREPVEVRYFCYKDTLQEAALRLMGAKVKASMALQGKFSAEGLTALTQSEDMMTALARALTDGLDGVETAERYWRSARATRVVAHEPRQAAISRGASRPLAVQLTLF